MRTTLIVLLVLAVLGVGGYFAYPYAADYWRKRNMPQFRESAVQQGKIVSVVNATGSIKPKLQIAVGSFVSGPITDLPANFNDEVKKGQLLARVDPRIYEANVDRDSAQLDNRRADVERVQAQLTQAMRDEKRGHLLREESPDFISQAELDKLYYNRKQLEAQLKVSQSAVAQAEGQLETSKLNVEYATITAPEDGIVINRKIDPGQTVASSFQTPELFVLAIDLREEIHVHASVDEADIGLIREAQGKKLPVHFTVDAYPEDLFVGEILEVRYNSTTTQNVVTYPVVVKAPNPKLKLLPGMTANISFVVEERPDVVKIPNAALRFFPSVAHVREADKALILGLGEQAEEENDSSTQIAMSAAEKAERRRERNRRHVWVATDDGLKAVSVVTGLSDSRYTEMVEGDLKSGEKLVTGIQTPQFGAQ